MGVKNEKEWFRQAEYDYEVAVSMFERKHYMYTVFICHLSIEKAFKGLYFKIFNEDPPRSHNLMYFLEKCALELPAGTKEFVSKLSILSVPTRYPEDLEEIFRNYDVEKTQSYLAKTREVLLCLKEKSVK